MKEYPKDYNGPKAGKSIQEEWIAVRDYNAFKYIRDGVWSYSDFDCWFYSCIEHHRADALKQFQKIQDK